MTSILEQKHQVPGTPGKMSLVKSIIVLVFGILLGVAIGRRSAGTSPLARDPSALRTTIQPISERPKRPEGGGDRTSHTSAAVDALSAGQDSALQKPEGKPFTQAADILERLTRAANVDEMIRQWVRMDDLGPGDAPFFSRKLSDPSEGYRRAILFELLLACGGPVSADALKAELGRTDLDIDIENKMIEELLNNGPFHRRKPIPVDSELRALASVRLSSHDERDRQVAVGILSHDNSVESRSLLHLQLEKEDAGGRDTTVAKALWYVGDESTLAILERVYGGVPELRYEDPATRDTVWRSELGKAYFVIRKRLGK